MGLWKIKARVVTDVAETLPTFQALATRRCHFLCYWKLNEEGGRCNGQGNLRRTVHKGSTEISVLGWTQRWAHPYGSWCGFSLGTATGTQTKKQIVLSECGQLGGGAGGGQYPGKTQVLCPRSMAVRQQLDKTEDPSANKESQSLTGFTSVMVFFFQ